MSTLDLENIGKVAAELYQIENSIFEAEAHVQRLKKQRKTLSQNDMPLLLAQSGITELKLSDDDDDYHIQIQDKFKATPSKENMPAVVDWLKEQQSADIVKSVVSVDFTQNEGDSLVKAVALLKEAGFDVKIRFSIHYQTLQKFIREWERTCSEDKERIPDNIFGIYRFKETKVTGV